MFAAAEIRKRMKPSQENVFAFEKSNKEGNADYSLLLPDIISYPYNEESLGPNSLDCYLHPELKFYKPGVTLPTSNPDDIETVIIPPEGLLLQPGESCLGRTVEYYETRNCVPSITGRSSIGRIFIDVHATAGFIDIGFCGTITLEITNKNKNNPVLLMPNMRIGQHYWFDITGEHNPDDDYGGRYLGQLATTESRYLKKLDRAGKLEAKNKFMQENLADFAKFHQENQNIPLDKVYYEYVGSKLK